MRNGVPGATASVSDTSDTVARGLLTGVLSRAPAGSAEPTQQQRSARIRLESPQHGFLVTRSREHMGRIPPDGPATHDDEATRTPGHRSHPGHACGTRGRTQCRAGGAARRRQDHARSAGPARCALARRRPHPDAGAAPAGDTGRRRADGEPARRDGRRHGRLPHPAGCGGLRRDPHRGHHRGPADPPAAIRSGAGWRRRRDPRRGARALAGVGPGTGALPRAAARSAPGTAPAGDVGHRRWRASRRPDGCRGDRERRPDVSGGDPPRRARHRRAARSAGRDGARRPRRAGGA